MWCYDKNMHTKTHFILYNLLIKEHRVSVNQINELFNLYLACEVKSYGDLFMCGTDFNEFICGVKDEFYDYDDSTFDAIFLPIKKQVYYLGFLKSRLHKQSSIDNFNFAYYVDRVLKKHGNFKNVLEVGCGPVPIISAMLKQLGNYNVSAMDSLILDWNGAYNNLGINAYNMNLTPSVDLSKFDVIVAKHPCPSIEQIVNICDSQNKPYIIECCKCNAPGDDALSWVPYLKQLHRLNNHGSLISTLELDLEHFDEKDL